MSIPYYLLNINKMVNQYTNVVSQVAKEKVMSYEEKSVGSTQFFQCEACPYMALAEDDIKFHLFTVHPELAKTNGLADNIEIPCPGCSSVFDAEDTLRTHLRNHHKMGIKDVKKMVKSLIQIALKNAKLKKEIPNLDPPPSSHSRQDVPDVKIPQVIEIIPDVVTNSDLPKGVTFISVDELQKMSTPNFEEVDPKEIIQEASINIVYTNDIPTQYVSVSESSTNNTCSVVQVSSVTPDLISSIQPRVTSLEPKIPLSQIKEIDTSQMLLKPDLKDEVKITPEQELEKPIGTMCGVNGCHIRLVEEKNLTFHRSCHQNSQLKCPECSRVYTAAVALHTHLWKIHSIDLELPTCEICGFKTYNRYRLYNIHMKCHRKVKLHACPICSKSFKNSNQLSKHKLIHKSQTEPVTCTICQRDFCSEQRLRKHISEVHEKVKPFKCSECDYASARKEQLTHHMRSHTGDKPFQCNVCEHRFSDHNSLRRHKKQHSKDNLYKCKYCPYSAIQSKLFASHMLSKHPSDIANDIHCCSLCPFKTVSKDKYLLHLSEHSDKESMQRLIELNKSKCNKPSWTIPSKSDKSNTDDSEVSRQKRDEAPPKAVKDRLPIELYDCDSLSESMPQNYSTNYCTTSSSDTQQSDYTSQVMVTDLSKDDNNSDCVISESSNDTVMERHQYTPQHRLLTYDNNQTTHHGFHTTVPMEQNLLLSKNGSPLTPSHCQIPNRSNNIMSNFPIRLPPIPHVNLRNSITLKPVDKISAHSTKVMGPIIKPTQILPVPSSSNSPVNISTDTEGAPRKKPKISVKSNLILKGPDQVNMFHSQQKMAFRRLEDNERFCLGGPVTFNNLITTQFMQLQAEPAPSESPSDIIPYPQEPMLADTTTTPVDNELNEDPQIFSFNQQINSMTLLPLPQKIQTNDPSYIKLEATIKQNTQSPSLERMCNILNNSTITREYKASPPLEDLNKNMNEIKNEVKSDSFYNMPIANTAANPPLMDQYLIDNIMGEKYSGLMDLSGVVLQEISEEQSDVIEIDDNSDDNKLLPRLDMFYPLESLYPMHNDFHFLDSDIQQNNISSDVTDVVNRIVEPIISQKEMEGSEVSGDQPICVQGMMDPMMNTAVRPSTNKINVKNIELMKN